MFNYCGTLLLQLQYKCIYPKCIYFVSCGIISIIIVWYYAQNDVSHFQLHCNIYIFFTVASFSIDSEFSLPVLNQLDAIGILSLKDLQHHQKKLQNKVKTRLVSLPTTDSLPNLKTWLREYATLHCSWRN